MQRNNFLRDWTVLAIDDDPDSLEIVEGLTRYHGATTYTAENGRQGLDLTHEVKPDFIITDLSMPVMDGWELIAALKKDRATAEIPVIALTAHAMVGDRERAIAAGCHNYLTKPLVADAFLSDLLTLLKDIPELKDQITW